MGEATARVALLGATGLIGGHLLKRLAADPWCAEIRVLVRRHFAPPSSRVRVEVLDFADRPAYAAALAGCDTVFSAIGTTQSKVKGDNDLYRRIDFDIPVHAAQILAAAGGRSIQLVSAVGANATSANFYIRLKGEVEAAVRDFGTPSVSVFRPSQLLGRREERRPVERVVQAVMKAVSPLLFGTLKKFKAIEADNVAAAMIAEAKKAGPGFHVLEWEEMMKLADKS